MWVLVLAMLQMAKFLVKFSCLSRGDLVAASLIHTAQAAPQGKGLEEVFSSPVKPKPSKAAAADATDAAGSSKAQKGKGKKGKQQAADAEPEPLQHEQQLGMDGDLGTGLGAYEAKYGDKGSAQVQHMPKTLHIQEALRILVQEFFTRMPGAKCQNCGCQNPSIKKQGSSKLFKQYSRRALLQNFTRGIDVAAAVAGGAAAAAATMERIQEQQQEDAAGADGDADAEAAGKKRKRGGAAADAGADEQQLKKLGVASSAAESKTPVPAVIKKQLQEQEDWVRLGYLRACGVVFCVKRIRIRGSREGKAVRAREASKEHACWAL